MLAQLVSVGAILLSAVFFLAGNGLAGTLTPLRADMEGFSDIALGALGAWYYLGFGVGCLAGPALFARAGHLRSCGIATALIVVSVLLQPIFPAPLAWFVLRVICGLGVVIVFMALESWLNEHTVAAARRPFLSIYIVVQFVSLILGHWLLLLAPPLSFELFSVGAILYCLCLIPIGLTRLPQPNPQLVPRPQIARLFREAPVAAAGCMTFGLVNGAFWTLAPVYTRSLEFGASGLALFMSVFIAGGAFALWPLGRISDNSDRRWIIGFASAVAAACGLALGMFGWLVVGVPGVFFGLVFVLGAAMLPLFSLSIAHANDRLPRSEFLEGSAGLVMISVAMSIPGPLLASFAIMVTNPHALFLFMALAHAAMAFFAFMRMRLHEVASEDRRAAFVPVPSGSPAVLRLDPRAPQEQT